MERIARGLEGIAIGQTRLSKVDGQRGELLLAGYPVEVLAPRAHFEELLFLLYHDRLPDPSELDTLRARLAERRELPDACRVLLREAALAGVAPMDALRMGVASLPLGTPGLAATNLQAESRHANEERALRLVAGVPAVVCAYARLASGQPPVPHAPALDHASAYLHGLTGELPSPEAVRGLTTYLNTTADHGMNASTFAARVVTSTRSDMVASVLAALGALKGPLHGGAPGPALEMVKSLITEAEKRAAPLADVAEAWVRECLEAGERIMGFGHRVYRVRDPRADVLAGAMQTLGGVGDEILASARCIEAAVVRVLAEKKPDRRLDTNVEFYTALLLHGLGLPAELFTPTFAVARVAGWTAHVLEQIEEDRLIRPHVVYAGAPERSWQPVEERALAAP